MPDDEAPASRAPDQQGPALPLSSPSSLPSSTSTRPPTAFTGETVTASELVETPGFSPAPVLRPPSPRPDAESFQYAGRLGPHCTRCNRYHWGLTLRCAGSEREPIRDERINNLKAPWRQVRSEYDHRPYDASAVRIEDEKAASRATKYGYHPTLGDRLPTSDSGYPEVTANSATPTASSFSWWRFPAEVRNMIYDVSLHWPSSYALYRGYNKQLESYYRDLRLGKLRAFPEFSGRLVAPTILLLCKHITNECIHILRGRTFIIDQIPPWLPRFDEPMRFRDFVGRTTLRNLRHIDIRIALGEGIGSGWVWKKILEDIFDILYDHNRFVDMRIMLKCCNLSNTSLWDQEEYSKYLEIKDMIALFRKRHRNIWIPGDIVVENWVVEGHSAKRVVPQVPEDDLETFYYPNKDIWPGSMLEFVQPTDPVDRYVFDKSSDYLPSGFMMQG